MIDLSDQLKRAIQDSGLTPHAIGTAAKIDPGIVKRFVDGKRGLTLTSASAIAETLGYRLVESARPATRRRK